MKKAILTILLTGFSICYAWDGQRQGFLLGTGFGTSGTGIGYTGAENAGDRQAEGFMTAITNFRIGYAYDFPTSELGPFTSGTHEIFLNYRIKIKNTKKDAQCPVYF